jgi:hypothetical protein
MYVVGFSFDYDFEAFLGTLQDFLRGLGGFAGALHTKYRRKETAN